MNLKQRVAILYIEPFKLQNKRRKERFLLEKKFNFAKHIVLNAASYIKEHLNDQLQIKTKSSPTDLVTQMDKEVQDNLVTWILEAYPADHILAEENGLRHSISDGNVWVIDPIDGTNNFVAQKQILLLFWLILKMALVNLVSFMM